MHNEANLHKPVLLTEVVANIPLKSNSVIVDATLGGGGHSLEIITKIHKSKLENVQLIALDLDSSAWERLQQKLTTANIELNPAKLTVSFVQTNFSQLAETVAKLAQGKEVSAVLADLGLSQNLLEREDLGLSFRLQGPLDMRLNSQLHVTAADLVNGLPKQHLRKLFSEYADIRYALSLAEMITDVRAEAPVRTTQTLNQLVMELLAKLRLISPTDLVVNNRGKKLEYSETAAKELAKVYQALRIAVNLEYENLRELISASWDTLTEGGKLLVITFHSGEERVLKQALVDHKQKIITARPREIAKNKRSRSAKLHVYTK